MITVSEGGREACYSPGVLHERGWAVATQMTVRPDRERRQCDETSVGATFEMDVDQSLFRGNSREGGMEGRQMGVRNEARVAGSSTKQAATSAARCRRLRASDHMHRGALRGHP